MSDLSYMAGPLAPQPPHEPTPLGPHTDPLTVLLAALTSSQGPVRPSTPGLLPSGASTAAAAAAGGEGSGGSSGAGGQQMVKLLNEQYERALLFVWKAGLEGADQLHRLEVSLKRGFPQYDCQW